MTDQFVQTSQDAASETTTMLSIRKQGAALYVDRSSRQWVVRDPDGQFWALPHIADCWPHRQAFEPAEDTDLEPVPGHYKHMLGIPI